ncbi:hypothetical protein JCM6882_006702 [Rhodosporidiobolus microsporus]
MEIDSIDVENPLDVFELPPALVNGTLIARLLSVNLSLLAAIQQPVGAKTAYTRPMAEDVRMMLARAPLEVQAHLRHAVDVLSSPEPVVSLPACLSAHASLATALSLLSQYSLSPPPTPAFSRLPNELLQAIVRECQFDDYRDRQNTNLALALTNRRLFQVVRPILHGEAHFFTPGQLERFWGFYDHAEHGRWAGRLLHGLVDDHLNPELHAFEMRIRPDANRAAGDDAGGPDDLFDALGSSRASWPQLFRLFGTEPLQLQVPMHHAEHGIGFLSNDFLDENRITRLQIGDSSVPVETQAADVLTSVRELERQSEDDDLVFDGLDFHSLHLPWINFPVIALSHLLTYGRRNCPRPSPRLTSLEVMLCLFGPAASRVQDIQSIFSLLAPSIRRLVIRCRPTHELPPTEVVEVVKAIAAGLELCTELRHLEIGGQDLNGLPPLLSQLPVLSLVLLPSPSFTAADTIHLCRRLPDTSALRSVTLCVPPAGARQQPGWQAGQISFFLTMFPLKTHVEIREAENRFWWPEEI